jgi:purine nucleosidase
MPIKLILDTDIGSDVDDAWALALCLASDEIDLLGVTLVHADLDTRAKVALKMLKLAGRTDIPVYKGISDPLTDGAGCYWGGHEGTDTDFSDIAGLSASDGAVDFILDTISKHPGEVVVAPIGPLTNVGAAIRRDPETMRKVRRFAIMGATYEGEGSEKAGVEHNIRCDPAAAKIVLESGIPATVVGLNVTGKVVIRRDDLKSIKDTAFGGYLAAMTEQLYELWGRDYTFMHDPLAIATEIDPTLVTTRKMTAEGLGEGKVAFTSDEAGPLDVCVDVDAQRFEQLLQSRVCSLSRRDGKCPAFSEGGV